MVGWLRRGKMRRKAHLSKDGPFLINQLNRITLIAIKFSFLLCRFRYRTPKRDFTTWQSFSSLNSQKQIIIFILYGRCTTTSTIILIFRFKPMVFIHYFIIIIINFKYGE